MYIGVSPPLSCQAPLNLQTVKGPLSKALLLGNSPYISYLLLKVNKFLLKISQFEFLVMTEQSILVYKLFCHEIFQILIYFLSKTLQPSPEKSHPPLFFLPQQPPSKSWGPVKLPLFWKFVRFNPPPQQKNGGEHTLLSLLLLM